MITASALLLILTGLFCIIFAFKVCFDSKQQQSNFYTLKNCQTPLGSSEYKHLYYTFLFSGLGVGTVFWGFEVLDPYFKTISTRIYFITFTGSLILMTLNNHHSKRQ